MSSKPESDESTSFAPLNAGFGEVFKPNRLSLGLVVPIETYATTAVPTLVNHLERVRLAESLGFSAVWLRDVPFNDPSFGDAGQIHDPFVYLGFLAAQTKSIALGVASIILPLRHPAHVAKAAASADVLSGGRLLLGVASGDRPIEYPALDVAFENRGERFRDCMTYIRHMAEESPAFENPLGRVMGGIDLLPKPTKGVLPLLVTGGSQQDMAWVAKHGDGWMTYPRGTAQQAQVVNAYREKVEAAGCPDKPVMQSLYVDVTDDPDSPAHPIHLGFSSGVTVLREYLKSLESIGVNHVALNLRFNRLPIESTLEKLAEAVLPDFH